MWSGRSSVNEAVLGKHNARLSSKQRRSAYALVAETLKFTEALDTVVEALPAGLLTDGGSRDENERQVEGKLRRSLAYVMIYDLLFSGRRKMQGGGVAKRTLLKHQPALVAARDQLLAARSARPGGRQKSGHPSKGELKMLIPPALRDRRGAASRGGVARVATTTSSKK